MVFKKDIGIEFRKFYVSVRNNLILLNRKRKSYISFELKNKIPRLIIHEKYQNTVKWILRFLALVGIGSSILTIAWPLNLFSAILLFLFEQFFEKTIFIYNTMFIQPIPEWESKELKGMILEIPVDKGMFKIGMLFEHEDYAKKLFECIRAWNYNQDADVDDNINLSFIIEKNDEYSVYLYPNIERKSIKAARKELEEKLKFEKYGKKQNQFVIELMICKVFPNPANSSFNLFRSRYKSGDAFEFSAYIKTLQTPLLKEGHPVFLKEEQIKKLSSVKPVTKLHLKIKNRSELNQKDQEYDHGRLVMEK